MVCRRVRRENRLKHKKVSRNDIYYNATLNRIAKEDKAEAGSDGFSSRPLYYASLLGAHIDCNAKRQLDLV